MRPINFLNNKIPTTIRDTFLARVAAAFCLPDPLLKKSAKDFLLRTMTIAEADYNFKSKQAFMETIASVQEPIIIAERSDAELSAIVYKMPYTLHGQADEKCMHEISFFNHDKKFTHKYDLTALANQTTIPKTLMINQLGHPVLHTKAQTITDFSSPEIQKQIEILKRALYATGGAGIAANQCIDITKPLNIILAGIDYSNPEHTAKAIERYSTLFLPMDCYLNARIIAQSDEQVPFNEGCLSVQGPGRGEIWRSKTVTIEYEDLTGKTRQKTLTANDARVMLHELDHINNGKVYFQHVLSGLSALKLQALIRITKSAIAENTSTGIPSPFAKPQFLFKKTDGQYEFNEHEVLAVFKNMPINTLAGIVSKTTEELASRPPITDLFAPGATTNSKDEEVVINNPKSKL